MNQLISEKSNSVVVRIAIIVFILLLIVVPFYESKRVIIWQSQSEGQEYNIFDYFVYQYAILSEEIKKETGLNVFFNQEYDFWLKIKESPVVFQPNNVSKGTNVSIDKTQVKNFIDTVKNQTVFIQAYNFWLDVQEKNKQTEKEQLKELPSLLAGIVKNETGVDLSLLIPKKHIIEENKQIAENQTNNNPNQNQQSATKPGQNITKLKENIIQPEDNNSNSLRSLIVGDSFMAVGGGLGDVVEKGVLNYGNIKVNRYGVVSSGLSRPDYFDWDSKIRELISKYKPNIAIVMFGANDNQSLTDANGNIIAKYGGQDWQKRYAKRVSDMLGVFKENNITVFWVGLPVMRNKGFSEDVENLNLIYQNECQQYQNAHFISTWKTLADNKGNYSAYLKDKQGNDELARIRDGVHLTYFGGALVTDEILKEMQEVLGSA